MSLICMKMNQLAEHSFLRRGEKEPGNDLLFSIWKQYKERQLMIIARHQALFLFFRSETWQNPL